MLNVRGEIITGMKTDEQTYPLAMLYAGESYTVLFAVLIKAELYVCLLMHRE